MKKQKNTFDVEFFINPNYDYKNHKLNVLKECLRAWLDPINEKFIPNEDDFIFFSTEHMETLNSQIYLAYLSFLCFNFASLYHLFI